MSVSKIGHLPFFLLALVINFGQGFQPTGSFGSTLEINGTSLLLSGPLYCPNSFGLLQSITPL
jgi:hypothetical protein